MPSKIRGRPAGARTRNTKRWTEARFRAFVISAIRSASSRWGPKNEVLKDARVSRGVYRCNGCKKKVPYTTKNGASRKRNVFVDHIDPVVDPQKGFENYDTYIERMFVEKDGLQVLCFDCHDIKSKEEQRIALERKKKEKEDG